MLEALVKCVDHLTVRVSPSVPLFEALAHTLLLPVARPLSASPYFVSGAIHLGNLNLEVMQVSHSTHPAQLYGIAFELAAFTQSLPELEERGIPHTPPIPFYQIDDQGWRITAWNTVFLGGLLTNSLLSRLFFASSQRVKQAVVERAAIPKGFRYHFRRSLLFDQIYRRGMTTAVDYNPIWREENIHQKLQSAGLEVVGVYEITIGARNLAVARQRWKKLLDPLPELAPGVWKFRDGPHLRIISSKEDGLQGMIWQVASINRAAQFLNRHEIPGEETDGRLVLNKQRMGGLDVSLIQ